MILSNRWLWTACAILCLALLPSACSPQPTAGIPPSVGVEPVDAGNRNMTQMEATETVTMPLPLRTEQPGTTGLPPTRPASQPLLTQAPGSALSEVPEELLEVVLADLARRLDRKPEEIDIVEVERVTWPDTSLDCPQPGMMYAQVLTPGYRLVLEAGGQTKEYRADASGFVLLCEKLLGGMPSKGPDAAVQDGWPNESRDPDLIIVPPPKRK